MAGIGFELRKIFGRKTLVSGAVGVVYASFTTIGPSLVFLLLLGVLQILMHQWGMGERESLFFTFSFTYLFLLAILTSHSQNGVISRYISDRIFEGRDSDISASLFGVLGVNCLVSAGEVGLLSAVLAMRGPVSLLFLLPYYLLGILSSLSYSLMIYVSAVKDYKKITFSYLAGVAVTLAMTGILTAVSPWHPVIRLYWSLAAGFLVICLSLLTVCLRSFGSPSKAYFAWLGYYKKHWQLAISNTAWILGFYITNLIYWFCSDLSVTVHIFTTAPNYDMAMFLAMLINFSGMVVFEVKTETKIFEKYIAYLSHVNSGVYEDMERGRQELQQEIDLQLFFSYEVQLIITIVLICLVNIFYPYLGVNTQVLHMFMLLGLGLYCAFCMYFTVILLYYFDDNNAAMAGPIVFLLVAAAGAGICCHAGTPFYPIPLVLGGMAGWVVSFLLLRSRLKNLNAFIMCH